MDNTSSLNTNTVDLSISSLVSSSDLVSKAVILILILASIWSWTIIVYKMVQLKKIHKSILSFEKIFWSAEGLNELYAKIKTKLDNPLSMVFVSAMKECQKGKSIKDSDFLKISHKDRIMQSMYLARNRSLDALEKNLGFLATVGSSAPFIGLFGTVWGIMHSFQSIAASKNTTLAVVAPGIAEALLATAIGLFAAIPAVIFYNYLGSEVGRVGSKIEDFIVELGTMLTRAIDEEKL